MVHSIKDMVTEPPNTMEKMLSHNRNPKKHPQIDTDTVSLTPASSILHPLHSPVILRPPSVLLHKSLGSFNFLHIKGEITPNGTDPHGWLTKADLYFQVNLTPAQKLKSAQMCMDGVALNWFTILLIKHPHIDWSQF